MPNKEDKELLEWYNEFQTEHPEAGMGMGMIPATIDSPPAQPNVEIELKPKEDEKEEDGDIKDIESLAEIYKAKAFVQAMLNKIDFLSKDQPDTKEGDKVSKYKADIKALAAKVVEIVNNVK
jgi:hypothetical protein